MCRSSWTISRNGDDPAGGRGGHITSSAIGSVIKVEGEDATISATRQWTLTPDGRTLTVEVTMNGPQGEMKNMRVFTRQS